MTEAPAPSSFAALRLERLKKLQELRAERDKLIAQDPGGARQGLIEQYPTALDFAERFDMRTRRTPALELLARRLRETVDTKDGRLAVSIPPQEGKSTLLKWLIVWLLVQDPDRRIVFASFAQSLARRTGREVRNLLQTHSELALPLDQSHRDATDWGIAGKIGGLYSVGVGGALTGRSADVMIIDDPLRGQSDADSDITRTNLHEWWESTSRTRLGTGAPALVVQTRWHEDDLAGRLVGQGWPLVNIPALADGRTEDALNREPGEWLVSARGRTPADWEATRKDVGERTFAALYQGRPAPLEGGIFQREWFNTHRLTQRPELDPVAIGVDPADTGKGDAAGILVAGVTPAGQIVFVADESGQLTQAQWARKACIAWIRHSASRIVQEHNLGMRTSIPDAWALLYRQATALDAAEDTRDPVARSWSATKALEEAGDTTAAKQKELHWLTADDLYREILDAGPTGPRVVSITPRQSKRVRAESVAGAFETGRACILGELKALEYEAATWQEGQKSPNRIDTLAMLTQHLESVRGVARVGRVSTGDGGAVIPINTAKGRTGSGAARGVTPMGMRRAMRGLPQSPHERDA